MAYASNSLRICAVLGVTMLAASAGGRVVHAQALDQQVALSVELLELSVAEWTERVEVSAGSGDESSKAAAVAAVQKKYETSRAERYRSYSTSPSDHVAFFATHATEVAEYLDEHLEIKGRIDELSQTIRNLIAGEESTGSANAEGAK